MPSLDRAALVAACLALPACVLNRQADIGRAPASQTMPAIQAARGGQSQEPPRVTPVVVSARSSAQPTAGPVLPVKAEPGRDAPDRVVPAAETVPAEPVPAVDADASQEAEPKRSESPLLCALKCYLNKSPEQAAKCLEDMDPADRDLLTALLPLAVRLGDGAFKSADPQDLATVVADVQGLVGRLRGRAALEVPKLCFCRPKATPAQFGRYEQVEENHRFRPGEVVGLYVEVLNLVCTPHGSDYLTQVQMAIEIHNEQGETVYRTDPPAQPDPSLSPRQDYCHVGEFRLPNNLPAGAYTLWLKVADVPTGRSAKRSLDFRVTTVGSGG